jgi:alkylhydroperoxidase family enzyme
MTARHPGVDPPEQPWPAVSCVGPTVTDDGAMSEIGFLGVPETTAEAQRLFDDDVSEVGYVMNVSRLWAYQPATLVGLFDLLRETTLAHALDVRQRGILVAACASAFGDSYCSLAWGRKLAEVTDTRTASGVLRGDDDALTPGERAMASWARKVARDPNHTGGADVQVLRDAGFTDSQIFAITVFVALRLAFSTVNDALGVRPDAALRSTAPDAVLDAVTFGRPIDDETPESGGAFPHDVETSP